MGAACENSIVRRASNCSTTDQGSTARREKRDKRQAEQTHRFSNRRQCQRQLLCVPVTDKSAIATAVQRVKPMMIQRMAVCLTAVTEAW